MKKLFLTCTIASTLWGASYSAEDTTESPAISAEVSQPLGLSSSVLDQDTIQYLIQKGQEVFAYLRDNPQKHDVAELHWQEIEKTLAPFLEKADYAPTYAKYSPSLLVRSWFASTDDQYNKQRKSYLYGIIALTWYFKDLAARQGEGFGRGSFSLIDPNETVYQFLLSYVKLVNGTNDPENLPYVGTLSNYAYRRDPKYYFSSHHTGRSPWAQYGIDIRTEANQTVRKFLPEDHTHILFGKLWFGEENRRPMTFFKTEEIGMGSLVAAAAHGTNFASGGKAIQATDRREKDIPIALQKAYNEFYNNTPHNEEKYKTVREMIQQAQKIQADKSLEQYAHYIPAAKAFLAKVEEIFPDGNTDVCVGNEVILDLGEIK